MIFTVILVYPCLLLESLVNCASVEVGSHQISPIAKYDHVELTNSRNSSSRRLETRANSSDPYTTPHNNRNDVGKIKTSPLATSNYGSLENRQKRLKSRQVSVSPSEWLFSTLIQQPPPLSTASSSPGQNERSVPLTYRSIAAPSVSTSNYYTNYYRNHNIYSQQQPTGRRVDGGEDRESHDGKVFVHDNTEKHHDDGLSRKRASLLPSTYQKFYANEESHLGSGTSKLPQAISPPPKYSETTGLSKTAPATDPILLGTERSTSTQEMQVEDDVVDFAPRVEIGRSSKRGRELGSGSSDSLYFHENVDINAPITFPGRSTNSFGGGKRTSSSRGQLRPTSRSDGASRGSKLNSFGGDGPWPTVNLNPSEARLVDGWRKLNELRQRGKNPQGRKGSVSSDAKSISILNIDTPPKCAQKNGYCDEIEGYPRSFFNQVLNRTLNLTAKEFQNTFGETIDNNSIFTDAEYSLRDGFDEIPLCSVREHTIYPKAAQNRQGKFMYIVNHDEYLQGIRVETCRHEKDSCMFTEGHLPGYTSICKQKYIYKKLLAFSPDGKPMPDSFRLPSCCVCYVKSMFISDRINPVLGANVNSDIQPTPAVDDEESWNSSSSSSTISYPSDPQHDDSRFSSTLRSSTEAGNSIGSITFPSTSTEDDLSSSFQVPTPTTSTSSTKMDGEASSVGENHNGESMRTTVQGTSYIRQEFIFGVVGVILLFLLKMR